MNPGIKIIIVIREPNQVIESIRKKGWFSDYSEHQIRSLKKVNGSLIPRIIPNHFHSTWSDLLDYEKALLYVYFQLMEINGIEGASIVDYKRLHSKRTLHDLLEYTNCSKGIKTDELQKSIIYSNANDVKFKFKRSFLEKIYSEAWDVYSGFKV